MQLDRMMEKIQKLLVTADHPNTSATEAATFRGHAEMLMRKYRVAQEELIATDPLGIVPAVHRFFVCGYGHAFTSQLMSLMTMACNHAGVRVSHAWGEVHGQRGVNATMVGYESDLQLAEWLYASARLTFGQHLEHTIDPTLTDSENVYLLRRGGMLRKDIALAMWGVNNSSLRSKAQRHYITECRMRGEQPQVEGGVNANTYRRAYADGFVTRFYTRLRDARDAADSNGGTVVLHGRDKRVDEKFYEVFPELRPKPVVIDPKEKPFKYRPPTKAQMAKADRMFYSPAANAGRDAGYSAADRIEISRVPRTPRIGE